MTPCFILPQVVLDRLAEREDPEVRAAALRTIAASAALRTQRTAFTQVVQQLQVNSTALATLTPDSGERKSVYDVAHGEEEDLPGEPERKEGEGPVADVAVNEAFDNADRTHDFYREIFARESVDAKGMELISSVHFGTAFDNAFWNGLQMVYGDGSGRVLAVGSLTKDLAVVAHEITHGVVQFTAGLRYQDQSGALNEHMADAFGSMCKQYAAGQTADEADWLVGAGVLGSALHGKALRSMKEPGTAYDMDDQPAHMKDYDHTARDNGGVHINSGIPNKAFYLVATRLGGHSWEVAGKVWYDALTRKLAERSDFKAAAEATVASATELYGDKEAEVVRACWKEVGVL
ncbi:M4 family metallopeptidase [Amycolatopsis acidicola]|uniref:Neutral metalloproteinase n=1 Tax=Amycolatopsis acidicola TaxID=2596893 RepID=A0A5N0V5J0_9PSEU|nr:M4 family metallopeptidase [Amycolatopsis acidicola]KAA9161646.1 M4 family metallopeptidase [Amycolatopsis acidicola]